MQNPEAADKLAKIQRDLDETKIILHKTIESVLDRGEKLDHVSARACVCFWGVCPPPPGLIVWRWCREKGRGSAPDCLDEVHD